MKTRIALALVAAPFSVLLAGASPDGDKDARRPAMPVYITPFYDSKGPKISAGDDGKKLESADASTIVAVCNEIGKGRDKLRAEVMYVAAIRLYDLGHKDEAVYWFYTAQYRARVFASIVDEDRVGTVGSDAFDLRQAYSAFNQLAGEYINGYAFGQLPKLQETLAKVKAEGSSLPKFNELYPKVKFVDEQKWAEQNKEVSEGLSGLIEHIRTDADLIKQQRKENGVEGKY